MLRPEDHAGTRAGPAVGSTATPFGNALRLARMLNDDRVIAELLAAHALAPSTSPIELADAVQALEALGKPDAAARLLGERIARYPREVAARVELAKLQSRAGASKEAVATWREVRKRFGALGMSIADTHEFARDLSRVGDVEGAYRVLEELAPQVEDGAVDLWEDLGTLAWELEDPKVALSAYRKVWAVDPKRPYAGARLMELAKEAGSIDEAVRVATEEFRLNGEPSALMFAADLEAERQAWAAVKRILALAERRPRDFARREDYWMLRGDAHAHLGESRVARESYETALALSPGSVAAKAALLSDAIDRDDLEALRGYVDAWRGAALGEEGLWSAYAVALDRLGRTREALAFYARHYREDPTDGPFALEFADALERAGDAALAPRLRRRALGAVRAAALSALHAPRRDPEASRLMEAYATLARASAGAAVAERYFWASRALRPTGDEAEPFAVSWYLDSDRPDSARRALLRRGRRRDDLGSQKQRLALALAEDDYGAAAELVALPGSLDDAERIEAATLLERDDLAGDAIVAALAWGGQPRADWAELLRQIHERHAPSLRVGASYQYLTGLDVTGSDVVAAHDLGQARIVYGASLRRMTTSDATLLTLRSPRLEADVLASARFTSPRGVSEITAGANAQPSSLDPRAALFAERLIGSGLGVIADLRLDDHIDDTPFLRVAGLRDQASLGVRVDAASLYATAELDAREDHTRLFHRLGEELSETGEAGLRLLSRGPEWDVGAQALAVQRWNAARLPSDVTGLLPAAPEPAIFFPPSYQLLSVVTHLTRGDLLERYRPDRTAFPRYECEAGIGVLLPSEEAVGHAQCSASFHVPGGYATALGFYDRGVAGIGNETSAEAALSYTHVF